MPFAGIMQRRSLIASRKAGFCVAVSEIALIVLKAMDGSFAQYEYEIRPESIRPNAFGLRSSLADGRDLLRRSDVPAGQRLHYERITVQ